MLLIVIKLFALSIGCRRAPARAALLADGLAVPIASIYRPSTAMCFGSSESSSSQHQCLQLSDRGAGADGAALLHDLRLWPSVEKSSRDVSTEPGAVNLTAVE